MPEAKKDWKTSLVGATSSTEGGRSSVSFPNTYKLTGIDGTLDGPLRPFHGMKEVWRIDPTLYGSNHDESSQLLDFFPVSFTTGGSGYAYGFVYRLRRKAGSTLADVYIDYWTSVGEEWRKRQVVKLAAPITPELDPVSGRQMSVTVWGRFIYVFIQDSTPVAVTTLRDSPFLHSVTTNPGPGKMPTLVSFKDSGGLGDITSIDEPARPGAAQIWLTEYEPTEPTLGEFTADFYPRDPDTRNKLKPGDYSFAYVLYNTRNGRRSALSELAVARAEDFIPPSFSDPDTAVPLYAVLEVTYDATKFDQIYVYRSVRVQSAGGTYVASILHLDNIITLAEYKTKAQDDGLITGGASQSAYWYELEDKALAIQDTYVDRTVFDEEMPKGGSSIFQDNTMIVSGLRTASTSSDEDNRISDGTTGIGETRWSSLYEVSPELFPPGNRYFPKTPNNYILTFEEVGQNVIGFSIDRQYMFRKEGSSFRVQELHNGFGVTGPFASESVGAMAYIMTPKGVKTVDGGAQLDELTALNEVIIRDWRGNLSDVSMAYDPEISALFILNPSFSETAVMWFNTAKVSLLKDTTFVRIARGHWPLRFTFDPVSYNDDVFHDDYKNPLVERVFWAQNPARNFDGDRPEDAVIRFFVVDSLYESSTIRASETGAPRRTMLPVEGDAILTLAEDYDGLLPFLSIETTSVSGLPIEVWGYAVYVLSSQNRQLIGKRAVVHSVPDWYQGQLRLTDDTYEELAGLSAGDTIGLSPIFFEVQCGVLPTIEETTNPTGGGPDPFMVKFASSIGCSFSDVSGAALTSYASSCRFIGLAFKGQEAEPASVAHTYDGSGNLVQSIYERESLFNAAYTTASNDVEGKHGVSGTLLSPGIRVITPDLVYSLAGIRVVGASRETVTAGPRT